MSTGEVNLPRSRSDHDHANAITFDFSPPKTASDSAMNRPEILSGTSLDFWDVHSMSFGGQHQWHPYLAGSRLVMKARHNQ